MDIWGWEFVKKESPDQKICVDQVQQYRQNILPSKHLPVQINRSNTRKRWNQWHHSGVFIVNFEHISYLSRVYFSNLLHRKLLFLI